MSTFGQAYPTSFDPVAEAASLLVFGTRPMVEGEEMGALAEPGTIEIALQRARNELRSDSELRAQVVARACLDTFGTATFPDGVSFSGDSLTYYDIMSELFESFDRNGEIYEAAIQRAYKWTVYREAYEEEIEYWKKLGPFNFIELVACVEDWARRNQPGLMVTGGTPTISANCEFLTTLKLSPEMAGKIRKAIGGWSSETESAPRILSPGAEKIVSSGGIHLLIAGSPQLRAAMSGN